MIGLAARSLLRVEAGIAHVPQGRQLFPFMSVRENLELGAYAARGPRRPPASLASTNFVNSLTTHR